MMIVSIQKSFIFVILEKLPNIPSFVLLLYRDVSRGFRTLAIPAVFFTTDITVLFLMAFPENQLFQIITATAPIKCNFFKYFIKLLISGLSLYCKMQIDVHIFIVIRICLARYGL